MGSIAQQYRKNSGGRGGRKKHRSYKIVVFGEAGAGKSALTMRFVHGNFLDNMSATLEDLYSKELWVNEREPVHIEILDTAGWGQFKSMFDLYISNGDGFVLAFNILSAQSFNTALDIHKYIIQSKCSDGSLAPPVVLTGNKCDLVLSSKSISSTPSYESSTSAGLSNTLSEQASLYARNNALPYFETSAKTGSNVDLIFTTLVQSILVREVALEQTKNKRCAGCQKRKLHALCSIL